MRWAGHIARTDYTKNVCTILGVKPYGKQARRWEDNVNIILIDLKRFRMLDRILIRSCPITDFRVSGADSLYLSRVVVFS